MQITFFDVLWFSLAQAAFAWTARSLSTSTGIQVLIWAVLNVIAGALFVRYFVEREPPRDD
ncbi:MAG TPA: hypothetical protein VEA69_24550 [Tepidisphaeraceae bacterium]|nr:hypothetical protein [Tepidisphaeraceae bacterium]